jgi:hypothetical protein
MAAPAGRGAGAAPYHRTILWLERRMFAPDGHRRVLAVSQRVADEVVRDYAVARERVRVVYNGVDLERFHPARRPADGPRVRAELGLGTRPVCVAIGTGYARKGFDSFLDVWRDTPPDARHAPAGRGRQQIARYRRQAGARRETRPRSRARPARRRRCDPRGRRRALPAVAPGGVRQRRPRGAGRRRAGVTSAAVGAAELLDGDSRTWSSTTPTGRRAPRRDRRGARPGWNGAHAPPRARSPSAIRGRAISTTSEGFSAR